MSMSNRPIGGGAPKFDPETYNKQLNAKSNADPKAIEKARKAREQSAADRARRTAGGEPTSLTERNPSSNPPAASTRATQGAKGAGWTETIAAGVSSAVSSVSDKAGAFKDAVIEKTDELAAAVNQAADKGDEHTNVSMKDEFMGVVKGTSGETERNKRVARDLTKPLRELFDKFMKWQSPTHLDRLSSKLPGSSHVRIIQIKRNFSELANWISKNLGLS